MGVSPGGERPAFLEARPSIGRTSTRLWPGPGTEDRWKRSNCLVEGPQWGERRSWNGLRRTGDPADDACARSSPSRSS